MDHAYLARHDGSEQAAGRGSGADVRTKQRQLPSTPYMHMTYYPIERRLDTAVWRALFASSTRQARKFIVHGWVKVNGKKVCVDLPALWFCNIAVINTLTYRLYILVTY